MLLKRRLVVLLSSALLLPVASCGGGDALSPASPTPSGGAGLGAGDSGTCVGSFTGAAMASFSGADCAGCSTMNIARAIDSDSNTFASQSFTAAGGTLTLRATAQSGTVFPAGRMAGAVIAFPSVTATATNTLLLRTYLGGTQQEQGGGFTNQADGTINPPGSSPNRLYRFATTKPFDAVETVLTRQGSADADVIRTLEFCNTN